MDDGSELIVRFFSWMVLGMLLVTASTIMGLVYIGEGTGGFMATETFRTFAMVSLVGVGAMIVVAAVVVMISYRWMAYEYVEVEEEGGVVNSRLE